MKFSMISSMIAAGVFTFAGAAPGGESIVEQKSITLDGANQVIAAIVAEAKSKNAGSAIAVVDAGGNLVALQRVDGTFAAGAHVSIGKARTAAIFKKPTGFFEDIIRKGRTPMVALSDFTPLQGGVPIMVDGQVVGAVGVSGASSAQQDEEFAITGANALTSAGVSAASISMMEDATYIQSANVSAAFAKGQPLLENNSFKIHASRRETAGQAEVHTNETDIIYVLEGTATFVTGGTIVGGKDSAPMEIRGASIMGGETSRLRQGDVIVVPAGTPHWFKEVGRGSPFLYFVVKVVQ